MICTSIAVMASPVRMDCWKKWRRQGFMGACSSPLRPYDNEIFDELGLTKEQREKVFEKNLMRFPGKDK